MLQKLEELILADNGGANLQELSDNIRNIAQNIGALEDKLEALDDDILKDLPKNQSKINALTAILSVDHQELVEQINMLTHQQKQLHILLEFCQTYLSQHQNDPRIIQTKIKTLKQIIINAAELNCPDPQLKVMNLWTQLLVESLSKNICSLVRSFPNSLTIQIDQIYSLKDLLTKQICTDFIKSIYKNAFVYDVPSYSYIVMRFTQINEKKGMIMGKREPINFLGQKSQENYTFLQQTITQLKDLSYRILKTVQDTTFYDNIKQQIQNMETDISSTCQYILPYLHITNRKKIMRLLNHKDNAQMTIYDILVKLRTKGQDGDTIAQNTQLLIERIKENAQIIGQIENFLYICQSQNNSLSIGFYIADELVKELEQVVDVGDMVTLLEIRESLRFQIHHPQ